MFSAEVGGVRKEEGDTHWDVGVEREEESDGGSCFNRARRWSRCYHVRMCSIDSFFRVRYVLNSNSV